MSSKSAGNGSAGSEAAPGPETVRSAAATQLDRAVLQLGLLDTDPVTAIHEARKAIKRSRALLRLLRKGDPKALKVEDQVLSNGARLLGGIRDQHVARQLEATRRGDPGPVHPPPLAPLVRTLVAQSSTILLGVRQRSDRWDLTSLSAADVVAANGRTYRTARRRWKSAVASTDPEAFHRCRTAVKRTSYQLEVLVGGSDDPRLGAFDQLGELLGDHHDHFVLYGADEAGDELVRLEEAIVELGTPLLAPSPADHLRWLRRTIKAQRRGRRH